MSLLLLLKISLLTIAPYFVSIATINTSVNLIGLDKVLEKPQPNIAALVSFISLGEKYSFASGSYSAPKAAAN